jgi:SAM-dependent methyltransferase
MIEENLSIRKIINRVYKDIAGFEIPPSDAKQIRKSKGSPIYGEINVTALEKLLDFLNLKPEDSFYDLGSGVGKVVMQTALTTPVGRAFGVELSATRHLEAKLALARALSFDPSLKNRIKLLNCDLLTLDLSEASVVYTCSTAFSQSFMNTVTKRMATFTHPFRLVSLQELPHEKDFELIKVLRLDMSWLRSTPVHVYHRR